MFNGTQIERVQLGTCWRRPPALHSGALSSSDRSDLSRVRLQIERTLQEQAGLRVLLAASTAALADRRSELRSLKESMRRAAAPTVAQNRPR